MTDCRVPAAHRSTQLHALAVPYCPVNSPPKGAVLAVVGPRSGMLRRTLLSARLARHASTRAIMHYQSERVPRSLTSTGRVGTRRDLAGSDGEFFGVDPAPTAVDIEDARGAGFTLDGNGFCMVGHAWEHIDYYDNTAILNAYYAEVEALVRRQTGATRAIAFDHNLRAKGRKQAGGASSMLKGPGASAVQEPLVAYGVHNDYTLTLIRTRTRTRTLPLPLPLPLTLTLILTLTLPVPVPLILPLALTRCAQRLHSRVCAAPRRATRPAAGRQRYPPRARGRAAAPRAGAAPTPPRWPLATRQCLAQRRGGAGGALPVSDGRRG